MIRCPGCGKEIQNKGILAHLRMAHPDSREWEFKCKIALLNDLCRSKDKELRELRDQFRKVLKELNKDNKQLRKKINKLQPKLLRILLGGLLISSSGEPRPIGSLLSRPSVTKLLERLFLVLDKREEKVLKFRFGIGVEHLGTLTLEEVSLFLDLTRERIRQIEDKALEKIIEDKALEKIIVFVEREGRKLTGRRN